MALLLSALKTLLTKPVELSPACAGTIAAIRQRVLDGAGVAVWLEQQTHILTQPLYFHFPGLGVLIAILAIVLRGRDAH